MGAQLSGPEDGENQTRSPNHWAAAILEVDPEWTVYMTVRDHSAESPSRSQSITARMTNLAACSAVAVDGLCCLVGSVSFSVECTCPVRTSSNACLSERHFPHINIYKIYSENYIIDCKTEKNRGE